MNKLVNAIDTIEESMILGRLDTHAAMASVAMKEDMITESYTGNIEDLKDNFGIDVVQEEVVLSSAIGGIIAANLVGAIASSIIGSILGSAIGNAIVDSGIKKITQQIKDVADIVTDAKGETDEKKGVEQFKKLKKALNAVAYSADRIGRNPYNKRHQHKRFYLRELKEFAKLADIAEEIISEKKIMKKRAKKYDDTSVLKQQLEEFFNQSKTVLEIIAKSAGLKVQGDKVVEDPNAQVEQNDTSVTEGFVEEFNRPSTVGGIWGLLLGNIPGAIIGYLIGNHVWKNNAAGYLGQAINDTVKLIKAEKGDKKIITAIKKVHDCCDKYIPEATNDAKATAARNLKQSCKSIIETGGSAEAYTKWCEDAYSCLKTIKGEAIESEDKTEEKTTQESFFDLDVDI